MSKLNFKIFLMLSFILLGMTSLAWSGEIKEFQQADFDTARKTKQIVVLHFHADWCPICKKQGPILSKLSGEFSNYVFFRVNFDKAMELRKIYKVIAQSTLLLFKNGVEEKRMVGVTIEAGLREFLAKGI